MNNNFDIIKTFKIDKAMKNDIDKRCASLNISLSDYIRSLIVSDIYKNNVELNKIDNIYKLSDINNKLLLKLLWYMGGVYETIDYDKLNRIYKENLSFIMEDVNEE
jgi:hypothetical protein